MSGERSGMTFNKRPGTYYNLLYKEHFIIVSTLDSFEIKFTISVHMWLYNIQINLNATKFKMNYIWKG